MNRITRRRFVEGAAGLVGAATVGPASAGVGVLRASRKPSDIRIEGVTYTFEEVLFRAPVGFAQAVMDRATLLRVECRVRTAAGKLATGFGSLPLNHIFSFPSKKVAGDQKVGAMKALAEEIAAATRSHQEPGHPIDINWALAPLYLKAAAEVSQRLRLADPIPKLCTLVTAGAFDAAVHDAFGKALGLNTFHTYGPRFMNHDLSHYLGAEYRGEYPSQYLRAQPRPRMPLCHLVSAADPLEDADNTRPIKDGLPETLREWIDHNGLTHLKIKVNGEDLQWDLERVLRVDRIMTEAQKRRRGRNWAYVLDFNEKCPNVGYFVEFMTRLKAAMPAGYARIQYVEQPTARDLAAHPENAMHEAAKLCPVVIDESLVDVESLLLARRMGWTGAVVKSPKGLTHMILIAAVTGKRRIFTAGGDMSCPGAALIQTAGLQARVPGISSVEANARQFLPAANQPLEARFPGMFRIKDGMLKTAELDEPGLGA